MVPKDNEMVNVISVYNDSISWFKDNEMVNAIYVYNDILRWFKAI